MTFFSRNWRGTLSTNGERTREQANLVTRDAETLLQIADQVAAGVETQTHSLDAAVSGANELNASLQETAMQADSIAVSIEQISSSTNEMAASIEQVTLTERGVIAQARSAFASYQSALRVIESSRVAVEANRLSLEGVRAENSVGQRTILDILNAEQELLNSQVTYVTAERDAYVAGFSLLAALGKAEARDLGLDGGPLYDPVENYKRVRNRISDWGSDPEPQGVGTPTRGTPAQGADVTNTSLDPVLQRPVDSTRTNP